MSARIGHIRPEGAPLTLCGRVSREAPLIRKSLSILRKERIRPCIPCEREAKPCRRPQHSAEMDRSFRRSGTPLRFKCPRCKRRVCGACEGGTDSELCDRCWCAVNPDPESLQLQRIRRRNSRRAA